MMLYKALRIPAPHWHAPVLLLSCVFLVGAAGAWAQSPITIDMGTAAGDPGETIEVSVGLTVGDTPPASMILYILMDPQEVAPRTDYYPVGDAALPVSPGPVLTAAGTGIDAGVLDGGQRLGVVITGSAEPLGAGNLFDMALTIDPGVALNSVIALRGSILSTATDAGGSVLIPVIFTGGTINVGCASVAAPQGLSATQNLSDRVDLSWNPITETGAEYRVYRANTDNVDSAVALGNWQSETTWSDTTATAAMTNLLLGCLPGQTILTSHYYYVRARTSDGCESAFAGPVVGLRSAPSSKTAPARAGVGDTLGLLTVLAVLALMGRFRRAYR